MTANDGLSDTASVENTSLLSVHSLQYVSLHTVNRHVARDNLAKHGSREITRDNENGGDHATEVNGLDK